MSLCVFVDLLVNPFLGCFSAFKSVVSRPRKSRFRQDPNRIGVSQVQILRLSGILSPAILGAVFGCDSGVVSWAFLVQI